MAREPIEQLFSTSDPKMLGESLDFIEDSLTSSGISKERTLKSLMVAEEMLVLLNENAETGSKTRIAVQSFMGDMSVVIESAGKELAINDELSIAPESYFKMDEDEAGVAIRSILLKSLGDKFKYSYKRGISRVRILVEKNEKKMLYFTLSALVLGLIMGLLMNYVIPDGISEGMATYILDPIKTMFMNALKIVIGPVVFFSLVTCISQFRDLSALGRIGAKVMAMYITTTIIAVSLATAMSTLLHPGKFGFALGGNVAIESVNVDTSVDTSILSMIINIVPSNLVRPFLESDTLQIIFLAAICGIAAGMIGQYSAVLMEFFEACNSLFLTITTLITRFIPIAVFCSVSLMLSQTGLGSLVALGGVILNHLMSIFLMITIYGLLILVLARLDPFTFFKKNRNGMLTSFSLSSSSAAMPTNLRTCTEKLGISPKVCSFSIPLGATINMDGTSIFLMTMGLFLARAYGITVTPTVLFSVMITVVLLSLGAPGVPGSALVCIGVILNIMGVPVEAIGLIIGITPILDMFDTMSNCTGDVTTALIVAKSEDLLDLKKFNSRE